MRKKASVEIDITRECNLHCQNCIRFSNIFNDNPKSRISINEAKRIFHELNSLFDLSECVIIGGEPTLHPHFKEMCLLIKSFIHNRRSSIYLGTNFTNEEAVQWFIQHISQKILFYDMFKENMKKSVDLKKFIVENFHLNLYNIKTTEIIDSNKVKKFCNEFNDDDVPIYIYKFNNVIRYAFCWNSVFISRLLEKENEFTFTQLSSLLNVNTDVFVKNICKYCIAASYISKNNINDDNFNIYNLADNYVNALKDSKYIGNEMNPDFCQGYKNMIRDKSVYV